MPSLITPELEAILKSKLHVAPDRELWLAGWNSGFDEAWAQLAPRRFVLERTSDVSGVSGTGRVAEGYEFEDGTVALRWLTEHRSTAIYASIAELEAIHGHGGATMIVRPGE